MVATDVASRGIGMIQNNIPPPPPHLLVYYLLCLLPLKSCAIAESLSLLFVRAVIRKLSMVLMISEDFQGSFCSFQNLLWHFQLCSYATSRSV